MRSQDVRRLAPEMDPLRIGMGWSVEDLEKPQILVESTFGDSHPGSAHLLEFVNLACEGVKQAGGRAARYFATDICDGMAQGHDGINYSLASRDMICNPGADRFLPAPSPAVPPAAPRREDPGTSRAAARCRAASAPAPRP